MRDRGGRFNFHETAAGQYPAAFRAQNLAFENAPSVPVLRASDGRESKLPFRQRNKKLVAERTHKSGNAALSVRARLTPAGPFLDWVSLNQSYRLATLYSVKGVHDVVPVEYGQEIFHRSGSVARPGLNIVPQDASSVLKGTN
jgi:hypothetical protein